MPASETVVYSSSDEGIATVSQSGLVTAKAVGVATITAKVGEVQDTVTINVSEANPVE